MTQTHLILIALAIVACACFRPQVSRRPARAVRFRGWQKVLSVVAFIAALLIAINPEFLALGLLGDAAFFDALVVLLTLQLHHGGIRVGSYLRAIFAKAMRYFVPSLRMNFWLALMIFAPLGELLAAVHKAVHRISS